MKTVFAFSERGFESHPLRLRGFSCYSERSAHLAECKLGRQSPSSARNDKKGSDVSSCERVQVIDKRRKLMIIYLGKII